MVKWEKVTTLKNKGGLGLRETRQANVAQLAKIGSRMIGGANSWEIYEGHDRI